MHIRSGQNDSGKYRLMHGGTNFSPMLSELFRGNLFRLATWIFDWVELQNKNKSFIKEKDVLFSRIKYQSNYQ